MLVRVYGEDSSEHLKEFLRKNLSYNPDTGDLWWTVRFSKRNLDKPVGQSIQKGYKVFTACLNGKKYELRCHRVAWFLYYGEWPKGVIDHVDRNPSNNSISNLRDVNRSQNAWNMGVQSHNTSGFVGVSFDKSRGRWAAYIKTFGKRKFLGRFDCPTLAAIAYDKASLKYHGDFGYRNLLK